MDQIVADLVADAVRKMDAARLESEKADDEAIHYKTLAMKFKAGVLSEGYDAIKRWERRALKAERELKELKAKNETARGNH